MNKTLKKVVASLTTAMTVLSMTGLVLLAPLSVSAATLVDGDLVRNPNADGMAQFDIYIVKIINSKNFKRLILSPHVFESYAHFDKDGNGSPWNDVQDVDQATMDAYTVSELVRADGDEKVYRLVATEGSDVGTKEWLNMTAAEFEAEGYDWDEIYTINTTDRDAYNAGDDTTADATDDEDADVVSEGTLTATLAADTPAAAIVVTNAARAAFTKINLTATGGDVIVDSMTIERTGTAAQDGGFSSIAVILDSEEGDQLGNNKTLNSDHETSIYDDFTIKSGETRSVYLTGNMGTISTTYAGEVPTLSLVAMTLKDDATLDATLPITGNAMTLNGTVTVGTATIVAGGNAPSASTQNVGINNYTVSSIKITAGSAEPITIKKLVWTQNNSASASDVKDIELINANTGEVLDTIDQPTSKTVIFNPDITIGKGKNVSFDLRLDIVDGSGRIINYDIDEDTDILVEGDTYGYYVTPTYTGVTARPYYPAPNTTIGDGSLRIESVAVTPTKIAEDVDSVVLGKFKFVSKGEEIKITSIGWNTHLTFSDTANNVATTSDITNITVYDEDDNVVAGPMNPTYDNGDANEDYGSATSTDTIIVPVGETIYTVKADLSADFLVNDRIQMRVLPSIITARGMTTDNSITPTPSDWIASTNLTVKVADLDVSVGSTPAAQTVVAGTQNFTFANYLLDATDSGSDIKITQVKVAAICEGAVYPDMVSGIELYDGSALISVDSDSVVYGTSATTAADSATTTLSLTSGALVITAGTSKTITVKADIGTGATIAGGDDKVSIGIQATGVVATDADGNAITEDITAGQGQLMTLASGGTLYLSSLTDPKSALVVAGSSGVSVGRFTLLAKYEDITLDQIGITLAAPDGGVDATNEYDQISSLELYEDGVATAVGTLSSISAATATITPSSLVLPAGTTKKYTLKATFETLNDDSPAQSGAGLKVSITGFDATGDSPGSTSITKTGLDATFNTFSIVKSAPTVTKVAFTGTDTITGDTDVKLFKLSVKADSAGPIGLYKLTFGITTSTVVIINDLTTAADTTGFKLYESESATNDTDDLISEGGSAGGDMTGTITNAATGEYQLEVYFDNSNDETIGREMKIISAGKTFYYTLWGKIASGHTAATTDTESISTVLAGDASFSNTAILKASDVDGKDQDDFIWSDLNDDQYATTTATKSPLFFGGYRVPGMPNTSSTAQVVDAK